MCPKPPNSTRTCVGAVCGFTCLANFADCDGNAGNGCEVNSLSDPTHCNSCTVACNSTNAMASCVAGACQVTCNPEFGDCDGDPSNGCECGLLNGCTMSTATDMTGQSQITVEFGSSIGHRYVPGCIVVSVGTEIVFDGNFNPHPMVGGTVAGGTAVPDATSPFWPEVTSGGSASFTLGTPGTFPYYCPAHFQLGMMSTIYVVP